MAMPASAMPWCSWDRRNCSSTVRATGAISLRAIRQLHHVTSRLAFRNLPSRWCSIIRSPRGSFPTMVARRSLSTFPSSSRCSSPRAWRALLWVFRRRFCLTTSTNCSMRRLLVSKANLSNSIPTSRRAASSMFRNITTVLVAASSRCVVASTRSTRSRCASPMCLLAKPPIRSSSRYERQSKKARSRSRVSTTSPATMLRLSSI